MFANQAKGGAFDEQYAWGDINLEIKGTGILRYMDFFNAYAGALYTLANLDPTTILDDTPKRLE